MSKNRIVIIGANDFQNQLILKAKSLGYETHVFAWEDGAVGKNNADFFYPISIVEKELILEKCKGIKPIGICSIASDLAAITVNYVAEKLGLACNSTAYSVIQTNKYEMRKALSSSGIPCPNFVKVDIDFDKSVLNDFVFPIIVKPTDRSGSRAITRLESIDGINEAVKNACNVSFEHKAIIEEYISGNEYSIETITQNGKHQYLATTKKLTTGSPHFIETGHIEPSDLTDKINEKAIQSIFCALDALHIENSAGHSEFKIDQDGNVKIIEIGARMGGGCIGSDLVYLSTGYDFMKMVIDVACSKKIDTSRISTNHNAEIHFILNRNDLSLLKEIKKTKPKTLYRISEIDMTNLDNVIDDSSRIGYYIICNGETKWKQ